MKETGLINKRGLEVFMENVVFLRLAHGFSKRKMAELLCISVPTLNKIENGIFPKKLDVDVVWQISDVFDITISDLFVPHNKWRKCKPIIKTV